MNADRPDLSIVIPAYQERWRLPAMLERVAAFDTTTALEVEVVVVDDGSTDGTSQVAEAFVGTISELRVLRLENNTGKGAAVRAGMLASTGRWRSFLDADGSVDPCELEKLMDTGAPVAIASVAVPGARLEPPQPWYRVVLGTFGNRLIQALVLPGISDSQRGCKVFRADIAENVFARCVIDGWGFDVEALALVRALGHEPVEVGVRWEHCPGGTIRPRAYLTTLRDVIRVRRTVGRQRSNSGGCVTG